MLLSQVYPCLINCVIGSVQPPIMSRHAYVATLWVDSAVVPLYVLSLLDMSLGSEKSDHVPFDPHMGIHNSYGHGMWSFLFNAR